MNRSKKDTADLNLQNRMQSEDLIEVKYWVSSLWAQDIHGDIGYDFIAQ